jgi:hypothetical protein
VTKAPVETTVELGTEFRVRRGCRRRQGSDDHLTAGRQEVEVRTAQVA